MYRPDQQANVGAEPGVLFAPEARSALRQGIDQFTALVRPTLGPTPRCVAIAGTSPGQAPEVLDDASTILRRTVQVEDPYINMGAMLLRHVTSRTHRECGDGTATTAVLLQAIVRGAERCIAGGADATALRRGLDRGGAAVVEALGVLARPIHGRAALVRSAEALCHDAELAKLLGEILDIAGVDGHVEVESGYSRELQRYYVQGAYWSEGFFSPYFISDEQSQEARLDTPAILVSDLKLTEAGQLGPLLERLIARGVRNLVIVADSVTDTALALLVANHQAGIIHSVAVKAPAYGTKREAILQDIAVLTGARLILGATGVAPETLQAEDLGSARAVWASTNAWGFRGGDGDLLELRRHLRDVRAALGAAEEQDERDHLHARVGKLIGGVAILKVGAETSGALDVRKTTAERTITALRQALNSGMVPGGGRAFLLCQAALADVVATPDERLGLQILSDALAEPLRVIARNAGYHAEVVIADVTGAPAECGFDALSGSLVDLWGAGILDPVATLQTALRVAVSGAVMALSTDVLIHKRKPQAVVEP